MARRTQFTITDEQHALLSALAGDTGLSMSELVRRALDRTYARRGVDGLKESFGAWKGRKLSGREYVERLRTGMAGRLKRVDGRPR